MIEIDSGSGDVELHQQQIDTRWFKDRLADRRLSQRQLAKRMGLDPAAVSLMLRGMRKLSAAEAADLARQLGVSTDEVLARAGSTPTIPARVELAKDAPATPVALKARDVATAAPVMDAGMIELPVPMADGSTARLVLPRVMGKADAQRIAALVQALAL